MLGVWGRCRTEGQFQCRHNTKAGNPMQGFSGSSPENESGGLKKAIVPGHFNSSNERIAFYSQCPSEQDAPRDGGRLGKIRPIVRLGELRPPKHLVNCTQYHS